MRDINSQQTRRRTGADPEAVWRAAGTVRLDETRTLGRLVRWRIPGTPIRIVRADEGAREGEFLFSERTVMAAPSSAAMTKSS